MSNRPLLLILALSAGGTLAHGQAALEHGVIDARSAAAAAGVGKAVTTIFGRATQGLTEPARPAPKRAEPPRVSPEPEEPRPPAPPAVPAPVADFSAISVGMDRADLIKLVGKPSMSVSGVESSLLVETFWYRVGAETVTVILRGGKIASIAGAEKLAAKK